jgi:multidrug efflux pump subunit AcrB
MLVLAMLVSGRAIAQSRALPPLIDQNVQSAVSKSERVAGDVKNQTPQLWIHVRSDGQKRQVEEKLDWFRKLQVEGRKVDMRPLQVVASGPAQSQLRYFKRADQAQAQALLAALKPAIPRVVLQDMSSQYGQATWIDPGHFELWLAPDVRGIAIR